MKQMSALCVLWLVLHAGVLCAQQGGDPKADTKQLVQLLVSGSAEERAAAADELAGMGAQVLPELVNALVDPKGVDDPQVASRRKPIADLIILMQEPGAIALLQKPFVNPSTNVWVRSHIKDILYGLDADAVSRAVFAWLTESQKPLQEFALADGVELLDQRGGKWVDESLLEQLRRQDVPADVVRVAARVFLARGNRTAGRELLKFLTQKKYMKDPIFLADLVGALGALKIAQAVPILIDEIRQAENKLFVPVYAEALGMIGGQDAADELLRIVRDYSEQARFDECQPIVVALGKTGDQRALGDLLGLLERKELRASVLRALGDLGAKKAVPSIEPYLEDEALRPVAVNALRQITGENFGYTNGQRPDVDAEAMQKLRAYLQAHADEWK